MPEVSVVVPIYNVAEYLPKCIESILAQTYPDYELILVNDGSKDNSPEIAEDYAKKEAPVDTGNLRNSITNEVEMSEKAAYIGTNVEYAPYVELGTSRSKAQPYLKPAATEHTTVYRRILEDELKG